MTFIIELEKLILKFIWGNTKICDESKHISRKIEDGGISIHDLKLY